MRFLCV